MLLGSHVSMSGKKMLLGSAEEAASYGSTTFMIYTGAPQNTRRKPIEEMNIEAGQAFMKEHNLSNIVVHAPYIINLGNTIKTENFGFAVDFLRQEIERAQALGATQITLHPGAHVGAGPEAGIKQIVKGLNEVLWKEQIPQIALETMAGKGTEIGRSFEEIAQIIERVELKDHLGVCLDTCHVYDAGYDIVNDLDNVLEEFDRIIGLDRLKAIHLNDSKNPFNSHKDRHEKIGEGSLGLEGISRIINHPKLKHLPFFLETPNELDGYKNEIEVLRKEYIED